jgi:hypothetical protein
MSPAGDGRIYLVTLLSRSSTILDFTLRQATGDRGKPSISKKFG